MKLLSRTTYILITTILLTFTLGGFGFYLMLKDAMDREIMDELSSRMMLMERQIHLQPDLYIDFIFPGFLKVEQVEPGTVVKEGYVDSILLDEQRNTYSEYKVLTALVESDSTLFRVLCLQSLNERHALTERIILIVTIIVLVFFFVIYLLNRFIFQRTWSDFFKTIRRLSQYDINRGEQVTFDESSIYEFQELNTTLNRLIGRIHTDYENIRQFTGNISHEIQTPLTVIRQKSEMLLQSDNLTNEQVNLVQDLQRSVSRLSKLNKTLVLLTKIESRQFNTREKVSIHEIIETQLDIIRPLAESNRIRITYKKMEEGILSADPMLADVLIVNLLKNAVSHNVPGGSIDVFLDRAGLRISNTGKDEPLDHHSIFERYQRDESNRDSLGLGLAIVSTICELYSFSVNYSYEENRHVFTLVF